MLSLPTRRPWCSIMQESTPWPETLGSGWPLVPPCAVLYPSSTLGRRDLVVAEIESLRGILNSTSNFVLGEMEQDRNYDEAIVEAQNRGIAEADPSLDVEGWDTANKLVIIANAVLGVPTGLQDLTVEGITGVTPGDLSQARERGKTIKLLARPRRSGDA